MPHRSYASTANYRFGFNGKENDNEPKGLGNQIEYTNRIYDSRLGRFLSVDPLQKKFAWLTPYQFAGNSPIRFLDFAGLEPLDFSYNWKISTEEPTKWGYTVINVYDDWTQKTWSCMQYPNDNKIYYWKPYDGSHQTFNFNTSKNPDGTWNGAWQRFEKQETIQAKYGADLSNYIGRFFAASIVVGTVGGGVALESGLMPGLYNVAINLYARIYPYLPITGVIGNKVAETLDETGAIQAEAGTGKFLLETARNRLLRTSVNSKLLSWIDKLYRANAKIESGSTGDAIRYELQGGVLPNSSDHLQKAKEALNGMRDLLRENYGRLDGGERKNIFEIIKDLTTETGLEWKGVNFDYLKNKPLKDK